MTHNIQLVHALSKRKIKENQKKKKTKKKEYVRVGRGGFILKMHNQVKILHLLSSSLLVALLVSFSSLSESSSAFYFVFCFAKA